MKNPLLVYTIARLGVFAVILTALILIGFHPILATVFATMIAFALSLVFLRRVREASSAKIAAAVDKPKRSADEVHED
jgi:uncharacterized membrane protein YkgB